jgi:hypothetical protein
MESELKCVMSGFLCEGSNICATLILRTEEWDFVIDVSGQRSGYIFKCLKSKNQTISLVS